MCAALMLIGGCATTAEKAPSSEQDYSHEAIRIGFTPDYPPVLCKQFGQLCGIEVDLAELVAGDLDAPVELYEMPFHELIPSLERGDIDVIMSGLSVTEERAQRVRFVEPYMSIGQMALVRAADANQFADADALRTADILVGAVLGSTAERYVQSNMAATCKSFVNNDGALAALRAGNVDAVIADSPYVELMAKVDANLVALPWRLTQEQLAWAVSRSPAADRLFHELDDEVKAAKRRGDVQRIMDDHIAMILEND
jgi:ABC-type amino acid transport substrate-binding protein